MFQNNYNNQIQNKISSEFLKKGYLIFEINNLMKLKKIRQEIKKYIKSKIHYKATIENLHNFISPEDLNSKRMNLYSKLNSKEEFLKTYYELGKDYLDIICGNELVMQRKINLSIQLSNDDSSLLPLHSDVWSGCSPFEVVLWIPMVDCKKTSSMYILSRNDNDQFYKKIHQFGDVAKLEKKVLKKAKFLNMKFGQGLIFQHSMLHGNIVNREKNTRISFNCRFKSVFSPYDTKAIGETFKPITLKPSSILGMKYNDPKVKKIRF